VELCDKSVCSSVVAELGVQWTDPDRVFTATINLMWQLHGAAHDQDVSWGADDLLVAISELELGPWQHLGGSPELVGWPFTVPCTLLDRLLVELLRVTPGFGARVAVTKARGWPDPDHRPVIERPNASTP
jgi:hypothetical protein